MKMDVEEHDVAVWKDDVERAIDNVKRTKVDTWMRKEWHKAGARDHWSEGRKAKWVGWRGERCDGPRHQVPPPRRWAWPTYV